MVQQALINDLISAIPQPDNAETEIQQIHSFWDTPEPNRSESGKEDMGMGVDGLFRSPTVTIPATISTG
ncbi:hypothetical protein N7507_006042 [Penicillium longicatenatum]|nr:hypothetical protein N7507_006042 [Penicillium longicatenatum]